jgi:hypothetical protein
MRRLASPSTNTTDTREVYLSPNHGALTSPTYPRVLLLLLKQHFPPPRSPYPIPQMRTREPRPAPHTVEARLSYVRSTNSTETCGTLGLSIQETYLQTATPDAWPRASARSAVARQCRKAVCRSFGSQIFNLMAKNHLRPKPASLRAGLYPPIHRSSAGRSGETDKMELVSLPPLFAKKISQKANVDPPTPCNSTKR